MAIKRSNKVGMIVVAVLATIAAAVAVTAAVQRSADVGSLSAAVTPSSYPPSGQTWPTTATTATDPSTVVTVPELPSAPLSSEALVTLTFDTPSATTPTGVTSDSANTRTVPSKTVPTTASPTTASPTTASPTTASPTTAPPAGTSHSTGQPAKATHPTSTTPSRPVGSGAVTIPSQYAHLLGWVAGGKVVTLTFDDGPSQYTGRVLDLLDKYRIKATFCQIGEQVGSYPAVEARIKAGGHTLCNHTWDHDEALPAKSVAVIDAEISRTQRAIKAATGITPRYFRAPAGDWGTTKKLRIELAKFHTIPLAWADDSLDWTTPGVNKIVHNVLSTVTPGAIILMHDGGGNRSQTLAALPKIIAGLKARGYRFVVLPQNPSL